MSALRAPSTPRSAAPSALPQPGSTPSSLQFARRKSAIPLTAPGSGGSSSELESLKDAVRKNDPAIWGSGGTNNLGGNGSGGAGGSRDSPTPSYGEGSMRPPPPPLKKRQSAVGLRSSMGRPTTPTYGRGSAVTPPPMPGAGLDIGDPVKIEVGGVVMEGTLRFLGQVDGKEGNWGGVELDKEWAGKGKNDGSVKGVQYFACPPACGLFLPLTKITPIALPPPPLPKASTSRPAPVLTAGSRASKYARLTASDLTNNPPSPYVRPGNTSAHSSPTKPIVRSRTPVTPSRTSSSPSMLNAITPKPRLPRPSFGAPTPKARPSGVGLPTPRRSTIGGAGNPSTPTVKRPPSSLRNHPVPPLPNASSSTTTPTANRRISMASSTNGSELGVRSTTPSMLGRSSSRMSYASEDMGRRSVLGRSTPVRPYSRQSEVSSRSSLAGSEREDMRDAKEREAEVRALLEASEKVGREVEDRLALREKELKVAKEQVLELEERERNRDEADRREREAELERERLKAEGGEQEALEVDGKIVLLEAEVADHAKKERETKALLDRLTREWETKFAAKVGDIESLRERLAASEEDRVELQGEVERLRTAGQALCATYEERISEIESSRLDAVEQLETMYEREREREHEQHSEAPSSESSFSPSGKLGNSLGSSHTSAADAINAESAQADLEHLRVKYGNLEEQLEEAKVHLEVEINDARRRRQKATETEAALKKDAKELRDTIAQATKTEARLQNRIEELEEALVESQLALENERSEVEGLRHDASGSSQAGLADEVSRSNKELAKAQADLTKSQALVAELRNDLRAAEKALEQAHQSNSQELSESVRVLSSTPVPQSAQDTPGLLSSPERRSSVASNGSRHSLSPKDDATASRDQTVGLKIIIQSMTAENHELVARNSSLMAEAQELRDAQRALEVTVENMMNEMGSPGSKTTSDDRRTSVAAISNAPLQREVVDLKTKLAEAEKRAERDIKALNQEVTELESLVESKIYREDELEAEIEKYKKLALGQGASGAYGHSRTSSIAKSELNDGDCEMCGEAGHDLDACPIFGNSIAGSSEMSKAASSHSSADKGGWCDDCEEYGHTLEACPMANEIF